MMKHSPGPWKIRYRKVPDRPLKFRWVINEKRDIAKLSTPSILGSWEPDRFLSPGEAEANARLIAAAPELLEALDRLLQDYHNGNNMIDAYNKASKAIARVTPPDMVDGK